MPKEVKDIKFFLELARRSDIKSATVKKNPTSTKFKVRGARYLYTLVVKDQEKAQKLIHSLPPGLQKTEIKNKKPKRSN